MKSINAGKIVALGAILAITLATAGCSSHRGYSNPPYGGYNGSYSNSSYPYNSSYSEPYYGGYNEYPAPTYTYRQQPANVTIYRTQPATVNVYHNHDNDAYRDHAAEATRKPYVHGDYDRAKAPASGPVVHGNHDRANNHASDVSVHAKASVNHDHDTTTHHDVSNERAEQD